MKSHTRTRKRVLIVIFVAIIGISTLSYFFAHPYLSNIVRITFTSSPNSISLLPSPSKHLETVPSSSSSFVYSLDHQCSIDPNSSSSKVRQEQFNHIFDNGLWNQVGSRSGGGSSLDGAYDWIRHLRTLFEHYSIRSVADVPCGDTWWQFSLRELNTIEELYFGGDISTSVIKQNQRLYGSRHRNKLFQYWDLVQCPIPTYTFKNSTDEVRGNHFDLIIVRDAIQHMHIRNGLKAVRNVVMSGAKFFALSTYPPDEKSFAQNARPIEKNRSLPLLSPNCAGKDYCALGAIEDGNYYPNNINCHPFNFPLEKAILVQASHRKFFMEKDQMHIYRIDEDLKRVVEQYDKACPQK